MPSQSLDRSPTAIGSIASRIVDRVIAIPQSIAGSQTADRIVVGLFAGGVLTALLHLTLATLGADLTAVTGIAVAAALTFSVGSGPIPIRLGRIFDVVAHVGLALAVVIAPLLATGALSVLGWAGLDSMASPLIRLLLTGLSAGILLSIPCASAGRLLSGGSQSTTVHSQSTAGFLLGAGCGVLLTVWLAAITERLDLIGWCFAIGHVVLAAVCWLRAGESSVEPTDQVANDDPKTTQRSVSVTGLLALAVASSGMLITAAWRITQQLIPTTSGVLFVTFAVLLTGVGASIWVLSRRVSGRTFAWSLGFAAIWCIGVATKFESIVNVCLAANATISDVWLLVVFRLGLLVAAFMPVAFAIGCLGSVRREFDGRPMLPPNVLTVAVIAGLLGSRLMLVSGLHLPQLILIAAAITVVTGLIVGQWLSRRHASADEQSPFASWFQTSNFCVCVLIRSRRFHQAMCCVCLAALVGSPWLLGTYDPSYAARRLFSTEVFAAYRNGVEPDQLGAITDSRLLRVQEGESGTITAWSVQGFHRQLRHNGISQSFASNNVRVSPHHPSEVLATVIPLLLHEAPREVLLLGSGGGLPVVTALDFPIRGLRWCDPDQTRTQLIQDVMWTSQVDSQPKLFEPAKPINQHNGEVRVGPFSDDRLQLLQASAESVLAADRGIYDVILSFPDSAALLSSCGQFTADFYGRASQRLTSTGIFCQRFQTADFGPEAIREALTTMSSAFEQVAAVESAPGEFVLLGTSSEAGFTRGDLLNRMQSPHVTSLLADVGWDWAITLQLNVLQGQAATEYIHQMAAGTNTAANGRFAFSLAPELMRWGNKNLELRTELGPFAHPLTAWLGELRPEEDRRISEVLTQRSLMADHPDQPFAYRAKLKRQLKSSPRSAIQLVSAETLRGNMHPEDKRRLRYFRALDEVQKQDHPTTDALYELASFEFPYDPLMSYFLHGEIAELATQQSPRNPAFELRHRLYSVYYADSRDRSVTVVADAIKLLAEYPDAEPDAEQRWDSMNGLLQMMFLRWNARKAHPPTSAVRESFNVDASLRATTAGLEAMDEWREECGISEARWNTRRQYLLFNLIHPLRAYRANLFPHQQRQEQTKLMEELTDPAELEKLLDKPTAVEDGIPK